MGVASVPLIARGLSGEKGYVSRRGEIAGKGTPRDVQLALAACERL
jgi:hypothetical protein